MSAYFHRIVRSDPIARGISSRGAKNRISTAATSCAPPLLRGEHILVGVALSRTGELYVGVSLPPLGRGYGNNHEVDYCLGGSLRRGGEEDADGLVFADGGGEGEYEGPSSLLVGNGHECRGWRGRGR
eukprot:scaffold8275_cov150-Isochrysis_galbana.AAC.1